MNYLHPLFALVLYVEAFLIIFLLNRWMVNITADRHSPTIDGLRGFLAFGVFIHHASIWFFSSKQDPGLSQNLDFIHTSVRQL